MKLSLVACLIAQVNLSQGFTYPPCEICGCSFCRPGEFPVGNLSGIIEINEERLSEYGGEIIEIDGHETTLGEVIANLGITEMPCSLLDAVARDGAFPPEVCTDRFRLIPILRDSCGCPDLPPPTTPFPVSPLPPIPPPVVSPPTERPSMAPTPCDICACNDCVSYFPMKNPDALLETEDLLTKPGFTASQTEEILRSTLPQISCNEISSIVSITGCSDDLRLNPVFRKTCGCPIIDDESPVAPIARRSSISFGVLNRWIITTSLLIVVGCVVAVAVENKRHRTLPAATRAYPDAPGASIAMMQDQERGLKAIGDDTAAEAVGRSSMSM